MAIDVIVQACLTFETMGLNEGAKAVVGVRLRDHVGEETRISVADLLVIGDATERVLPFVDEFGFADNFPFHGLLQRASPY